MFNTEGKELDVLFRISQLIPQLGGPRLPDIPNFLEDILGILHDGIGVLRGTFTLRRPDTDVFVVEASKGLTPEQKKRGRYKLGEGITGQVAKTGQAGDNPRRLEGARLSKPHGRPLRREQLLHMRSDTDTPGGS